MDAEIRDNSVSVGQESNSYSLEIENNALRTTLSHFKNELDRLKSPPLIVCDVVSVLGEKAIIRLSNNNKFYVNIIKEMQGKVKAGDRVFAEQKFLNIVERLEESKKYGVESFLSVVKPNVGWREIGGLSDQINEIREVVELPLKNKKIFERVGIVPPKGVLLYGPPGSGKTLLAKAVASSTKASFIEIVGSELVQKFIGEGAKLVKDIFKLAKEKAPCIIFIDEIDAIAAERLDVGTSGEREVQRTFMQLLAELDGFKPTREVKVICATNRIDILDPAILRPGRMDRVIEIPLPDKNSRKEIFRIHTKNMNLKNVDFNRLLDVTDGFSGSEIRSVCTEAGYFAIREKRFYILEDDFVQAINKIMSFEDEDFGGMFG